MNKFITLMVLVAFLFTISYFAATLGLSANTEISAIDSSFALGSVSDITNVLGTFFDIMLFRIEGIPNFITLVVFYPITFGIIYMIVDIAKDLIPFT